MVAALLFVTVIQYVTCVAFERSTETVQPSSGAPGSGVTGIMYQIMWFAGFHPQVNQLCDACAASVPVHCTPVYIFGDLLS
jgi:hypothetical protein